MQRVARAVVILSVALGSSAVTAHGQDAAGDEGASPDFQGALEALGHDMTWQDSLGDRLSTCLRPLYPDSPEHLDVVLAIEIDAEGMPGSPYLLDPKPDDATLAHLRQLFRAEAAIFDCAPLTLDDGSPLPEVLSLSVSGDSLRPLPPDAAIEQLASDSGQPAPIAAAEQADSDQATEPMAPDADDTQLPPTAASAETEAALGLNRAARREVQTRLRLAGHDPGGADGVFGPRTRSAVSAWQEASGLIASGYLDETQYHRLVEETEEAFADLPKNPPAASTSRRARFYRGPDGCLRDRYGRRVGGQSLRCDLRGLFSQF
ncbi:hypothetical protein GE300_00305 [Rhodobacteraceae bacterium 2CG4]|uniref:Peptidoglycan binding-like domain-containing protein n=1 Tax=Halovulum marinum TaxID=2662447 RepID=A0A6L5YWN1_9RHOB|nr:peptidoglycan-binding domain-containing protein [Halovulum marinum]MSU88054.1 hypothetical protein [Halovulum marinum]